MIGQDTHRVGADADERRMAEADEPAEAQDEVQAHGRDAVAQQPGDEPEVERLLQPRRQQGQQQQGRQRQPDGQRAR